MAGGLALLRIRFGGAGRVVGMVRRALVQLTEKGEQLLKARRREHLPVEVRRLRRGRILRGVKGRRVAARVTAGVATARIAAVLVLLLKVLVVIGRRGRRRRRTVGPATTADHGRTDCLEAACLAVGHRLTARHVQLVDQIVVVMVVVVLSVSLRRLVVPKVWVVLVVVLLVGGVVMRLLQGVPLRRRLLPSSVRSHLHRVRRSAVGNGRPDGVGTRLPELLLLFTGVGGAAVGGRPQQVVLLNELPKVVRQQQVQRVPVLDLAQVLAE